MIPDWLRKKVASPPAAGEGVHTWLFDVARQLHHHMPPEEVFALLRTSTAACGRPVPEREITDAVKNSISTAWVPSSGSGEKRDAHAIAKKLGVRSLNLSASGSARWPHPDPASRRCRLAEAAREGVAGMADLWEASPVRNPDTIHPGDWIERLFPGAEYLCLAKDHPATALTLPTGRWISGLAKNFGLVVPSPMKGLTGLNLSGNPSPRCLSNTGPRRWLVIEFDDGTKDEQAALHWHLRQAAEAMGWPRLALVNTSGGKSLHGWYGLCDSEQKSEELMAYARSLGADPATWNRCQLVRLPGGLRRRATVEELADAAASLPDGWTVSGEIRQAVFFWDPAVIKPRTTDHKLWNIGNMNYSVRPRPSDSMPRQNLKMEA